MEKSKEILIFDDLEYCKSWESECQYLFTNKTFPIYSVCKKFDNIELKEANEYVEGLWYSPVKCNQCKEAYREIKQSTDTSEMYDFCHDCNKELYGWFKNCPNCGEKLTGYANKKISFANKFKELLKQQ